MQFSNLSLRFSWSFLRNVRLVMVSFSMRSSPHVFRAVSLVALLPVSVASRYHLFLNSRSAYGCSFRTSRDDAVSYLRYSMVISRVFRMALMSPNRCSSPLDFRFSTKTMSFRLLKESRELSSNKRSSLDRDFSFWGM